ncbi:Uma2 family endonuclease [Streptomyces sp. P9(2023)]|uniref:Uma2 family endonuclease n=1 Tax=Streptomyces sp. P9(2023) TaxID=3064394 RepID=UPI0028F3ED87|nr:Uma2 family endonuclease [Streptomyces sp. P9(2023)]MDT9688792.1 Uma2 family endonuclease [Streptomyces sp. P9(2023)]
MSALAVEPEPTMGDGWDELVRICEETDAPEGCKVEIIEGIVTVSPPPANQHNSIAAKIHRRLIQRIPEDWNVYQTLGLALPEQSGMYIPDLAVVPEVAVDEEPGHFVPVAVVELVVEITSKWNANHDRIEKLRGYATAGVPLYLLVDRWHSGRPTATLYGEPKNGLYRVLDVVEFGREIRIPAPFDLTVDTSEFPVN